MAEHKFTNALANETSPYLLQHAHNPVQWHPWSEEALEKARRQDKPILLSIGYAACHWCHVMAHESFENEEIAALMNEHFINIKVDREERPDLDTVYMQSLQMMTGHGGWPMTVFLTPDQVPFYAGTYFPPEDRQGMPGFPRVLESVARAYGEKGEEIRRGSSTLVLEMQKVGAMPKAEGDLAIGILDEAASRLLSGYDADNGGFGTAPKFPASMALDFLMRTAVRTQDRRAMDVVDHTLEAMACGGVYDQLGGGFHRYSVDAAWLVPHFEKMLYDNALLSRVYLQAHLLTGKNLYRRICEEILDYVLHGMTSPDGGFYATEDADSEGVEGKFYTWTLEEVESLLPPEDARLFCTCYGVTGEGVLEGANILHLTAPLAEAARMTGRPENELAARIRRSKELLSAARAVRVRPARDEKILTSWNGLMIRSFAEAGSALDRRDYRTAAVRAADFLQHRLRIDGRLLHTFKDGKARIGAYLDDVACCADAFLSLYEATFDRRWLQEARHLAETIVAEFQDSNGAGFFMSSADHESLIDRPRDFYDNATPSGNSVAVHAFLRLAHHTGDETWSRRALEVLKGMARLMAAHPSAFANFLCALDFALADVLEIAVSGNPEDEAVRRLQQEVFQRYLPNKVVACGPGDDHPLLHGRTRSAGKPTAYVCRGHVCLAPVTDAPELGEMLDAIGATHPI